MLSRELITLATITTLTVATTTAAAAIDLDFGDYETIADADGKSLGDNESRAGREVRCYCNQPECVSQGYMCRGGGCFAELPSSSSPSLLRPEHGAHGCLEESFGERRDLRCPAGFLCCEQDLCNHVDSPATRSRLDRTLQVVTGDQRVYPGPVRPNAAHGNQSTDGWFKTATIAVPICGLVVLLVLASLAIRLLQPVPTRQADKLGQLRTPDNAPPLLGPPKVPLV